MMRNKNLDSVVNRVHLKNKSTSTPKRIFLHKFYIKNIKADFYMHSGTLLKLVDWIGNVWVYYNQKCTLFCYNILMKCEIKYYSLRHLLIVLMPQSQQFQLKSIVFEKCFHQREFMYFLAVREFKKLLPKNCGLAWSVFHFKKS